MIRLAIIGIFWLCWAGAAGACLCGQPSLLEELEEAEAIFQGRVVGGGRADWVGDFGVGVFGFDFAVDQRWKGATGPIQRVHIFTDTCSEFFQEGTSYLVFAVPTGVGPEDAVEAPLVTSQCRRTRNLADESAQADRAALNSQWQSGLPRAVRRGTSVALREVVQPALYAPAAEIVEVQADLRALGVPDPKPLSEAEAGVFRLEGAVLVEAANGPGIVAMRVRQTAGEDTLDVLLERRIDILPAGDLVVFADSLAADWQTTGRLEATDALAYGGGASLAAEGLAVGLAAPAPVDQLGYAALHFSFHLGTLRHQERAFFNVRFSFSGYTRKQVFPLLQAEAPAAVRLEPRQWQTVSIPLAGLDRPRLAAIEFTTNLPGVYYLDEVRLVGEEARTTTIDEAIEEEYPFLVVGPNYPNPFNAQTAIPLRLAQPAKVAGAVFNTGGQRIASLGTRQLGAGQHLIHWSGVDAQGRPTGSGVYYYRLWGTGRTATGKLLLLR